MFMMVEEVFLHSPIDASVNDTLTYTQVTSISNDAP